MGFEKPSLSETAKKAPTERFEELRKRRLENTAQAYKMSVDDLNTLQRVPASENGSEMIVGSVHGIEVEAYERSGFPLVKLNGKVLPEGDAAQAWKRLMGAISSRDSANRIAIRTTMDESEWNHIRQSDSEMVALRDTFWGGESPEHEGFSKAA